MLLRRRREFTFVCIDGAGVERGRPALLAREVRVSELSSDRQQMRLDLGRSRLSQGSSDRLISPGKAALAGYSHACGERERRYAQEVLIPAGLRNP